MPHTHTSNTLKVKSLGIDTYRENIIFMRADCHICESEGFMALTRIIVEYGGKQIIATLDVIKSDLVSENEAGLSEIAFERLGISDGDTVTVKHLHLWNP
jgi:thymidine phosphorylase